jgi:hypothetical protein
MRWEPPIRAMGESKLVEGVAATGGLVTAKVAEVVQQCF